MKKFCEVCQKETEHIPLSQCGIMSRYRTANDERARCSECKTISLERKEEVHDLTIDDILDG